jgi:hypothetical protein
MPKLLDTRLIGLDIGDVNTRDYSTALPGQVLQVAPDGESMILGAGASANFSYLSRDAEAERSGISIQQYLCRTWHDLSTALPASTAAPAFRAIYGMTYGIGIFWIAGVDTAGKAKIVTGLVDDITGSSGVETSFSDAFRMEGVTQYNSNSTPPSVSPFDGAVFDIKYENGILLACGANGKIATLGANGWTSESMIIPASAAGYYLYRLAYGQGKGWVAVGTKTSSTFGEGVTLTSEDGFTWQIGEPALGVVNDLAVPVYGVAYGGAYLGQNLFVAVGGVTLTDNTNHIAVSYDGRTWTPVSTAPGWERRAHYSVAFGNGVWMVGTQGPAGPEPENQTASSWIYSTVPDSGWAHVTGVSAASIQALAYGNGMFVGGSSFLYGSLSGSVSSLLPATMPTNWTIPLGQPSEGAGGTSACYGNGIFLVASRNGKLMRSSVINEVGLGPAGPTGAPGAPGAAGPQGPVGPGGAAGPSGSALVEFGAVGAYTIATMQYTGDSGGASVGIRVLSNETVDGSYLYVETYPDFPYDTVGGSWTSIGPSPKTRVTLSGVWRNMGGTASAGYYLDNIGEVTNAVNFGTSSLWQRIS